MSDNEERDSVRQGFVGARAQERAMLKVLCKGAISRVFDELEPVEIEPEEVVSKDDVFTEEIRKWGGEPKELQGRARSELVWLIQRKEELYQGAISQCTRAQQEREDNRRVAEAERDARREAEARVVELEARVVELEGVVQGVRDKLQEAGYEPGTSSISTPIVDALNACVAVVGKEDEDGRED